MPIVYASFADMQARFTASDLMQLADVTAIGDAQTLVEQKLAKAATIIDGYVAVKYGDRSGQPVPALLAEIACDIAFYELHRSMPPEKVKDQRDQAMKMLRDIAAGTLKIDEGVVDAIPARPGAVIHAGEDRIFGRTAMEGY